MSQGWVKLHRELMTKAIWLNSTPEQKSILITLLMMANHQEKEWEWKGQRFKALPGQFVTSLKSIADNAGKGISIQSVRTALNRFERYDFLTNESTKTGRLVTIVNWQVYQQEEQEPNNATNIELTKHQQRPNKELTPNKNDKNDKNDKEDIYSREIIDYLNEKASKGFKASTRKNQELIKARMNEGFNVEDFKKVIDNKVLTWKGDSKMDQYLRPVTLFGTKFESYLNENVAVGAKSKEEEIAEKYKDLDDIWTY